MPCYLQQLVFSREITVQLRFLCNFISPWRYSEIMINSAILSYSLMSVGPCFKKSELLSTEITSLKVVIGCRYNNRVTAVNVTCRSH